MKKNGEKLWSAIKGHCFYYLFLLLITGAIFLSQENVCMAKYWDNGKLEVSANGHYLQHENGVPFLWVADTAWALIMRLDASDAGTYFSDRASRGYTVIQTTMSGLGQGILDASWQLGCNEKPFINDNPKTPNEAYWQHVDEIIALAESHNLYIAMTVPWKSLALESPEGWREKKIFTIENTDDFATFLANRYKNSPNIIWIIGGDTPGHAQSDTFEMMNLFGTTINNIDTNHLITYHGSGKPACHSSSCMFHQEPWLDLNMTYPGWGEHYAAYLEDYNLPPAKPAVSGEAIYAGYDHPLPRRQFYWNTLAGGAGYTHGRNCIWNMWRDDEPNHVYLMTEGDNWWTVLGDSEGTLEFMYWKDFFTSIEWWKLIPDNDGIIVSGQNGDPDWIKAAARSSDGDFILVYYPERTPAEINMAKITSGSEISAKWWNPADKSESEIGTYFASGTQSFTPPSGWEDALLVLTCEAQGLIGYWTMNSSDISGTTLFDKSDNGNDGIIHGAVSTTGNIGEALDFNGTGDYVSLSSSSIKDNSAFSIGVWIKVVTGGVIYSEGYSENRNWAILLGSNAGSIRIIFKEKGVWKGETKGTTLINDGQWYYIVVAQTNKSYREIFVDGVLEGTNTTTIGDMSILDTYTIGALERTSVSSFFDGLIDDMKIYDYALSSDDILGLYRSTKGAISQ